jgi:hypothetical protein
MRAVSPLVIAPLPSVRAHARALFEMIAERSNRTVARLLQPIRHHLLGPQVDNRGTGGWGLGF